MMSRMLGLRNMILSPRNSSCPSKLGALCRYTSRAAACLEQAPELFPYDPDEYADVDWDNIGFNLMPTDYMYVMKCSTNEQYEEGKINQYGNIELSPSAGVLNYGQGLIEGLKAYRKEGGGLLLFRPDLNAQRMRVGADRLCMPAPTVSQFVDAVKQITLANKRWVPPPGKGSLYIRPLLIGSGPMLGLAPAPDYTFLMYASPVRNYFKDSSAPLSLYVDEEYNRAYRSGTGGVKSITNYAPILKAMAKAKSRGFSDVLYLDSVNKRYLEEASASNVFIVKDKVISTPATNGTILSGVTRKSVIEIARNLGYQVEERVIPVDELMQADEVFCTGTAMVVAPVGSITHKENKAEFKADAETVTRKLHDTLVGIQMGLLEDKFGWTMEIE